MKVAENIREFIGNTPLVRLNRINPKNINIFCKLEYFNPGSSVKDRLALAMLTDTRKKGIINENSVIIEPTRGNAGIGHAMMGAILGYRTVLTMPESTNLERRKIIAAYGAELFLTNADKGMNGAIEKAEKLLRKLKSVIFPNNLNEANPEFHRKTTAIEIWNDTDGVQ